MKKFVIGDCHGRYKALKEVLQKAKFNYEKDILIVLGDIVDGGSNTAEVVNELLKIKNVIFIIGNHEQMFIDYVFKGDNPSLWVNQGGANTLNSYGANVIPATTINENPIMIDVKGMKIPNRHIKFFSEGLYYFEFEKKLFVHGGFNPKKPIQEQDPQQLIWDRSLIKYADTNNIDNYEKIFIGHTSTQYIEREFINYKCRDCNHEWDDAITKIPELDAEVECETCNSKNIFQSIGCTKPLQIGNLVCLDTGAGWDGKLTIMNIDDNTEYYQSTLLEPAIKNEKFI